MSRPRRSTKDWIDEHRLRLAVSVGSGLSSLLRPGSLVILFAVALTGVGLGFKEAEFPKSSIWEPGEPALIALVILGAISYLGSALVIIGYRRSLRRSDQDSRLYRICRDVAALVERNAIGLGRDDIAAHIWTVRGLSGFRRLERRATFLPGDRQSTAILWRKGKGAIGRCWETNQPQLADLEDLAALAPSYWRASSLRLSASSRFSKGSSRSSSSEAARTREVAGASDASRSSSACHASSLSRSLRSCGSAFRARAFPP